jgi:hypothetical protein
MSYREYFLSPQYTQEITVENPLVDLNNSLLYNYHTHTLYTALALLNVRRQRFVADWLTRSSPQPTSSYSA